MNKLYLVLSILGALIPLTFLMQFFSVAGINLSRFVSALFVNWAAGGVTADLLISSFVFWLYMFQKQRKGKEPKPGLFIFLNLFLGLSCALPAYLYAREE